MSKIFSLSPSVDMDHSYSILSGIVKPNEWSPACLDDFNNIIMEFMREHGVPGAAVVISLHGKLVYKQGYGTAGSGQPVMSSSVFRIASISKILTAIGVMKLCEGAQLSLEDKVFRTKPPGVLSYLRPKCSPGTYSSVTVEHLLQHSAGWDRDVVGDHVFWYHDKQHSQFINPWDNEKLLRYVLSLNVTHKPGKRHAYSNLGYMALGMLIERITGMKYEDYILSILRDLEINSLRVGHAKKYPRLLEEVEYYNRDQPLQASVFREDGMVEPQYGGFPMESTGAYGGWVACAEDLVHLIDSLVAEYDLPHPISYQSVRKMLARPRYEGSDTWYGLGLDVEDGGKTFGHTGVMEGTSTTLYHDKSGLSWALLLNSWPKDVDLNGLVRYALSSVPDFPLWQGVKYICRSSDDLSHYEVSSADGLQCVQILVPHCQLNNLVQKMKCWYKMSCISAVSSSSFVWFNMIWERIPEHRHQCFYMDLTLEEALKLLNNTTNTNNEHGFEILLMDSYVWQGKINYVFLATNRSVHQRLYCVDSSEKHLDSVSVYQQDGFYLVSQSVLYLKDKLYISALYNQEVKPRKQTCLVDISIENFTSVLRNLTMRKFRLAYIKFYDSQGSTKISAIWTQEKKRSNCFQRYNVSKYGFMYELHQSMNGNLPVQFVSSYIVEDVVNFAAIWDYKYRKSVDKCKKLYDNG